MIRAVADTHALLWYLYADPRLSATAEALSGSQDPLIYCGDDLVAVITPPGCPAT
jgi:hypothetical protein